MSKLKNDEGGVVTDSEGMQDIVINYFDRLFESEECAQTLIIEGDNRVISEEQNNKMTMDFSLKNSRRL